MSEITGDSGEYEYITEAIALSKHVNGMCVEIGLRRGMGTKTILDAVKVYCPHKTVISIDPFGSIPYVGREHVGPVRLDYDNPMRNQTMQAMWNYVAGLGVNWIPFIMTDKYFFHTHKDGIEINDIESRVENKYSMCHLDGPHTIADVSNEISWFNERMNKDATIVIDDVTIDFMDIKPIQAVFKKLKWEQVRMGEKKGIWQKC